jgi:hypothetical protein
MCKSKEGWWGGGGKSVSLHFMKACGGVEVQLLSLLTLALDGGVWKTANTTAFLPGKEHPLYSWIGGCVGPRTGLGVLEKRKICGFYRESNHISVHKV